jgi:hypothetical protein
MIEISTAKKDVVEELGELTSKAMMERHTGEFGSICFVVRRPGWVLCREQGLTLLALAAHDTKPLDGFGLFGVIKETGVDDVGLLEFATKFFTEPLYRDTELAFYRALGDRRLSLTGMLWGMFVSKRSEYKAMSKRLEDKEIEGNLKGEGLKQGGVIIFDKKGEPKYAYLEETGKDIVVADLVSAVQAVRLEQQS